MTNTEPGPTVSAPCMCRGRNQRCSVCHGDGTVAKRSCRRCGGVGKDGPTAKCPDCRGHGFRDIDNMLYEI